MKILIPNYTFNAAAKQITLTYTTNLGLDNLLLITNVTKNVIIYNFASTGGTIVNNVLTLAFDTTSHSNNDKLLIYVDDGNFTTATEQTLSELSSHTVLLRRIVKISEALATADSQQRQRITIDAITSGLTLSTITTVGTVSTVTAVTTVSTVTTVGTVGTVTSVSNIVAANISTLGNVPTIENQIQWSRTAYGAAIRPNLVFS